MISFVIGALVTVFTFYIALIYASVTIGLLGFAEAILLVLAFLFLLWYRRKIEADIQIPIAVAEPGEKVRLTLAVKNHSRISCMKIKLPVRTLLLEKASVPGRRERRCITEKMSISR